VAPISLTRRLALAAAVLLLDVSLAFQNVWPTPLIRWNGELSVEFGVFLILLVAWGVTLGPPTRRALRWLTIGWMALVFGHYADVTAPALYGRDVNLYWDVRFMPDVAAMITRAAPFWLIAAVAAAAAAIVVLLYVVFRWAIATLAATALDPRERAPAFIAGVGVVVFFALQQFGFHFKTEPPFAAPVV